MEHGIVAAFGIRGYAPQSCLHLPQSSNPAPYLSFLLLGVVFLFPCSFYQTLGVISLERLSAVARHRALPAARHGHAWVSPLPAAVVGRAGPRPSPSHLVDGGHGMGSARWSRSITHFVDGGHGLGSARWSRFTIGPAYSQPIAAALT